MAEISLNSLYWLDQIQAADRPFVGDKAFYLSFLMQRSYPVIPGFVVPTIALQGFLETIDWLEPLFADLPTSSLHLDVDDFRQLQAVCQQIRQAIQTTAFPKPWLTQLLTAVQSWEPEALILRPSLAVPTVQDVNFSSQITGLLESQVCWADAEAIAQSVKRCWAELFRAKSLLYWQRLGIQLQNVQLAILVQPLRAAIVSGEVQFKDRVEVRSTWGLGRALVNGEVTPDVYYLDRQTGAVEQQQIGNKPFAYQIGSGPAIASSYSHTHSDAQATASATNLLPTPDCLQSYLLELTQQHQYTLNSSQLQRLFCLTQAIAADLGTALRLEWIWAAETAPSSMLYLTQVIPQPSEMQAPAVREAAPLERPLQPAPQQSRPTIPTSSAPRLMGLPAASGRRAATAWVISIDRLNQPLVPDDIAPGSILVSPSITPDWLGYLQQASGLITEQGGMTSHGAIVARELGIPAVVGVANATQLIQTGDVVFVDGDRGEVYRVESALSLPPDATAAPTAAADSSSKSPAIAHATQLFVNLSQTKSLDQFKDLHVDGVGLLRAELMLMEILSQSPDLNWQEVSLQSDRLPDDIRSRLIDRIAEHVCQFAQAFNPRPIFYRSLDLRSHEYRSLQPDTPAEPNPILGWHGTLSYQQNSALFITELTALRQVQQAGYTQVNLILPFVRTVEEFRFCRAQVMQAGLTQIPHFQLWIMAEVPSVLFLLPDYVAAGVQGISIGSNDLTQLLLGVDRDHPRLATTYNQRHPAVLRAIRQLIETARELDIPCSICGEAPSQHPDLIDELVQWGIRSISVNPDAVERSHWAIARAEQRLLLELARQIRDGQ